MANVACVPEFQAIWDGPDKQFIGEDMGTNHASSGTVGASVSLLGNVIWPQPTHIVGAECRPDLPFEVAQIRTGHDPILLSLEWSETDYADLGTDSLHKGIITMSYHHEQRAGV